MRPLFPRWSNTVLWTSLACGAGAAVALPTALMAYVRTPYVTRQGDERDQPVMFDHRHHTRDDGIDCRYCHAEAERSPYGGVPTSALCMNCHGQIWNSSPLLEPVRRSYFENRPIVWARVHGLPDFVFFDHSIHVKKGVGCVTCHGRVDLMARVSAVAPLTMDWCLDCHREPARYLRPPEHVAEMEWTPEPSQEAVGARVARELDVAPPTHCTACHY